MLHWGRIVSGRVRVRRVRVPAGGTVTLDETEFSLRPAGWKKSDRSQMLQLAPGKYRVSTIYLPQALIGRDAPEGTLTERLTTGELELTVLAASAGGSGALAPVPRKQHEVRRHRRSPTRRSDRRSSVRFPGSQPVS